ncbi:MAG: DUF1761 domain-containing protein [Vicingaceae bacterium]
MKRKILTIILGTSIIFVWNALSWTLLPFHSNSLKNIPNSAFDAKTFQETLLEDGVYHYPGLPDGNEIKDFEEIENRLKKGPRITLMVVKKGPSELFDLLTLGVNLIFNILAVIAAFIIVSLIENKSFKRVFLTTFLVGLTVALMSDLPQMNWYMFPPEYTLTNVLDHLVAFSLLGLLFGRFTFYKA